MFKLSTRLQAIYDQMIPGVPVWDTCCDHGKIGLNAHESGLFGEVHLVDQVPEIIQSLKQKSEEFRRERGLSFEGLHFHACSAGKLKGEILGNFVIAGVGAHTIQEILQPLLGNSQFKPTKIIISCHNKTEMIEAWLAENLKLKSYFLLEQLEVMENERLRKVWIYTESL